MSILGVDSGSSIVKLVVIDKKGEILHKAMLNKTPILQAIETFTNNNKININSIEKIVLTGVGKDEVEGNIYNIPTIRINEFEAIGIGGLYLSNQQNGLVISIGTGTAFVKATQKHCEHIGGTGVGGGTLLNLCKNFGNVNSFKEINNIIPKGSLKNVDLTVQDVATHEIKTLPKDTTSANFGKLNENASKEDIILGITNMVFETIGMMAVFATQNTNTKNIIVVGSVATMPYIKTVFAKREKMYNLKFIIPKEAEFACTLGAIKVAN